MTTSLVIGVLAVMGLMIWTQMGRRAVRATTFVVPLALAAYAAYKFMPSGGATAADVTASWLGGAFGAVCGILAGVCIRVERTDAGTFMQAGWAYAAIWLVLGLGRLAFAWLATHGAQRAIGMFMMSHHLSAAGIQGCFIWMALLTIVARTVALGWKLAGARAAATAAR